MANNNSLTDTEIKNINRLRNANYLQFYTGASGLEYVGTIGGYLKEFDKTAILSLIKNNISSDLTYSEIIHSLGYIPVDQSTTITINGNSQDLTESRTWTIPSYISPLTTKGDILTYGTADARLPIGTNGQVLMVDSTKPTGNKWDTVLSNGTSPIMDYGAGQFISLGGEGTLNGHAYLDFLDSGTGNEGYLYVKTDFTQIGAFVPNVYNGNLTFTPSGGDLQWTDLSGTGSHIDIYMNLSRGLQINVNGTVSAALTYNNAVAYDWKNGLLNRSGSILSIDINYSHLVASDGFTTNLDYSNVSYLYSPNPLKIGAYTLPNTDGTSGYVLSTDGLGAVSWVATSVFTSPLTTKGDIFTRNGSADARLPIGTNGQILMVDSLTGTGNKWYSVLSSDVISWLGYTPYNSTNPSGYISTISGISAGGDLSGTYPNPTVAKLNGVAIAYLTTKGDILSFDGTVYNRIGIGSNGSVAYVNTQQVGYSAAGTTGQILVSGGTGAPTWSGYSVKQMLFTDSATAGKVNGDVSLIYDTTNGMVTTKPYTNSFSGTSTVNAFTLSGSPYTTGTSSTPPLFLIQDAAPSSAWSALGTYFGINANSSFTGILMNLQKNGSSKFKVDSSGNLTISLGLNASANTLHFLGGLTIGSNSDSSITGSSGHWIDLNNSISNPLKINTISVATGDAVIINSQIASTNVTGKLFQLQNNTTPYLTFNNRRFASYVGSFDFKGYPIDFLATGSNNWSYSTPGGVPTWTNSSAQALIDIGIGDRITTNNVNTNLGTGFIRVSGVASATVFTTTVASPNPTSYTFVRKAIARYLDQNNTLKVLIDDQGYVGISTLDPTALLHLAGGTATAGTASLKINSGTLLTATENGAIESDGTYLYWTDDTAVRHNLLSGGGGGVPGGTNTQLQYNTSGSFGGISGATSNGTNIFIPTLYGASATANNLTLRANAADLTTGFVVFSDTSDTSSSTTGAAKFAGGVGIAKKLYVGDVATVAGLTSTGSVSFPYTAQTSTYAITSSDFTIDCTSGTFTVTLPTAVGIKGTMYVVRNSGSGVITLATTSSQTISDISTATTLTINPGEAYMVQSSNTNWIVI